MLKKKESRNVSAHNIINASKANNENTKEEKTVKVGDNISNGQSLVAKLEDKFGNSILDDDSLSTKEVIALHERIEALKY